MKPIKLLWIQIPQLSAGRSGTRNERKQITNIMKMISSQLASGHHVVIIANSNNRAMFGREISSFVRDPRLVCYQVRYCALAAAAGVYHPTDRRMNAHASFNLDGALGAKSGCGVDHSQQSFLPVTMQTRTVSTRKREYRPET